MNISIPFFMPTWHHSKLQLTILHLNWSMDFTYDAYKLFATHHKFPSLQGFFFVKVFINKMSNLEKLDESRQEAVEIIKKHQWNHALWAHQHYKNKS